LSGLFFDQWSVVELRIVNADPLRSPAQSRFYRIRFWYVLFAFVRSLFRSVLSRSFVRDAVRRRECCRHCRRSLHYHTGAIVALNRYTKLTTVGYTTTKCDSATGRRRTRFATTPSASSARSAPTARTLHTQSYVDATDTINDVLTGSIANANANGRAARAVHRHVAARNRQRWLSSLVNNVGRHVVLGTDSIICIGDYRSSSTRVGQRGGGVPYEKMVDVLVRNFLCLDVAEPYSSQKAPTNGLPVRLATRADIGRHPHDRNRLFVIDGSRASDGAHTLMLDRDVSVGPNMVQLALNKLARDTRPVAFNAAAGVGAAARSIASPMQRCIRSASLRAQYRRCENDCIDLHDATKVRLFEHSLANQAAHECETKETRLHSTTVWFRSTTLYIYIYIYIEYSKMATAEFHCITWNAVCHEFLLQSLPEPRTMPNAVNQHGLVVERREPTKLNLKSLPCGVLHLSICLFYIFNFYRLFLLFFHQLCDILKPPASATTPTTAPTKHRHINNAKQRFVQLNSSANREREVRRKNTRFSNLMPCCCLKS
jgi:hypothetical protein